MKPINVKNVPYSEWNKVIDSVKNYRYHDFKSWIFWLAVIGFGCGIIGFTLAILNMTLPSNENASIFEATWARLWFGIFHYFTNQTNLILLIYYLLFFFFFKTFIFKRKDLTAIVCLYINLVMFSYWFIMFPQWLKGDMFDNSIYGIIQTMLFHLVTPIIFNCFVFFGANYPLKKIKNPLNRIYTRHFIWIPIVYIFIYSIYTVVINFISLPPQIFRPDLIDQLKDHYYVSVYGSLTNFNSACFNIKYVGTEIEINKDSTGNILNTLHVFAILFLYVLILVTIMKVNNYLTTPKAMLMDINESNNQYIKTQQNILTKYSIQLEKEYCKNKKCLTVKKDVKRTKKR